MKALLARIGDLDHRRLEAHPLDAGCLFQWAPPIYHPLDPPFVANLSPGGKAKMLQAAVRIQTRDPALVTFLQQNDPMVRHHLLSLFGAQDAAGLMTGAGREQIQADVQATLARLVKDNGGEGAVEAVYFTQFVLQ